MSNSGLKPYGTMEFVQDSDGEVGVVLNGDFDALIGKEIEARPIKVQNRTVLAEIGKIQDTDGEILDRDTIVFGSPTISDIVATLKEMGTAEMESVVNAISGVNPARYDSLVGFVASRVPGKVDFKVLGQE